MSAQTLPRVGVRADFRPQDPTTPTTAAIQFRAAARIRRELERCIEAAMSSQPASLNANLDRLGSIRVMAEAILPLLPDSQRIRSDRNLVSPRTVADWIEAARITGTAQRAPEWAPLACDRLDHIEELIHSLAALTARVQGAEKAFQGGAR